MENYVVHKDVRLVPYDMFYVGDGVYTVQRVDNLDSFYNIDVECSVENADTLEEAIAFKKAGQVFELSGDKLARELAEHDLDIKIEFEQLEEDFSVTNYVEVAEAIDKIKEI